MDVTPLIPEGRQIIQSYGTSGFRVNDEKYGQAICVTPEKTSPWCHKLHVNDLRIEDFSALFDEAKQYDVYLLGTGETGIFLPQNLLKELRANHIKIECMDSGAACRTYNVLMAEGRRIAALLLPL